MPVFWYKAVEHCSVKRGCARQIIKKGMVLQLRSGNPMTQKFVKNGQLKRCNKAGELVCLKKKTEKK